MPDPKLATPVKAEQRGSKWVVVDADGKQVDGGGPFTSAEAARSLATRINGAWEKAKADRKAKGAPEITEGFEERLHPRGRTGRWVKSFAVKGTLENRAADVHGINALIRDAPEGGRVNVGRSGLHLVRDKATGYRAISLRDKAGNPLQHYPAGMPMVAAADAVAAHHRGTDIFKGGSPAMQLVGMGELGKQVAGMVPGKHVSAAAPDLRARQGQRTSAGAAQRRRGKEVPVTVNTPGPYRGRKGTLTGKTDQMAAGTLHQVRLDDGTLIWSQTHEVLPRDGKASPSAGEADRRLARKQRQEAEAAVKAKMKREGSKGRSSPYGVIPKGKASPAAGAKGAALSKLAGGRAAHRSITVTPNKNGSWTVHHNDRFVASQGTAAMLGFPGAGSPKNQLEYDRQKLMAEQHIFTGSGAAVRDLLTSQSGGKLEYRQVRPINSSQTYHSVIERLPNGGERPVAHFTKENHPNPGRAAAALVAGQKAPAGSTGLGEPKAPAGERPMTAGQTSRKNAFAKGEAAMKAMPPLSRAEQDAMVRNNHPQIERRKTSLLSPGDTYYDVWGNKRAVLEKHADGSLSTMSADHTPHLEHAGSTAFVRKAKVGGKKR